LTARKPSLPGWKAFDLAIAAAHPDEAARLLDQSEPDSVYCVGGATDVEHCESEPQMAFLANEQGPTVLAAAAAARQLPFLYFSTEYVFDGKNGPYQEDDPVNALSVYGKSKLAGERGVLQAHSGALILRTTVVYGYDGARKNFLYGLLARLSTGQQMRVAEDQISTPTYNKDLATAAVSLLGVGASGIYHVCGPERMSRFQFALSAAKFMGLPPELIIPAPTPSMGQKAPRPLDAGLSIERLNHQFPAIVMRPLAIAIREFITSEPLT
jgi:dTDP-4-dehydrorhamnose reductase